MQIKVLAEKYLNTRKRKVAAVVVSVVIIGSFSTVIYMHNDIPKLELKKQTITVEYGTAYNPKLDDLVKTEGMNQKDKNYIIENTHINSNLKNETEQIINEDGTVSEKDKGYVAVGDYELVLHCNKQVETVKIKVCDTIKPQLNVPETIEIVQGTDLATFNFKAYIIAEDLAKLNEIEIDYSSTDTSVCGEYTAKAAVEDINKNRTEKDFKIVVTAPASSQTTEVQNEKIDSNTMSEKKTSKTTKSNLNVSPKQETNPNTDNTENSNINNDSNSSSDNQNSGNIDSGNISGSGGEEDKPESIAKIKVYWAKCEYCGFYIESTLSIEDVKNKIRSMNNCSGNSSGEHRRYRYGVTERPV